MSFQWCEYDKYNKGVKLEKFKEYYDTYNFKTLEELAISMKPLTTFDADDIVKLGKKNIINQIPENIQLKSKPFKLSLDEFDDFIFNEELFDEDSIDIETLDEKEIDYIDTIRKNLKHQDQKFILVTERGCIERANYYKQVCSIFMLCTGFQSHLFKKNYYK